MNSPRLTTGSSSVQTVSKPEWSKHYALLPKKMFNGRWIWLRHYYIESQTVSTPINEFSHKIKRRYTTNEAMMLMLTLTPQKEKPANWGQMKKWLSTYSKMTKE